MLLFKKEMAALFRGVAEIWSENKDYLSEIDSRFGDGDHGVTIGKIANLITAGLDKWSDEDMEGWIMNLGDDVMAVGGGSAGPLYGTMIGGLADSLTGGDGIDTGRLKTMFADSLAAMREITKAGIGDKTMMDSLIPAVEAAEAAEDDVEAVLKAAAEAAERGAKDSEQYVSKYGRARSYKEQTIGTPDAGAVSTALFFKGLYRGFETLK